MKFGIFKVSPCHGIKMARQNELVKKQKRAIMERNERG
jgi:hypothetical protein